MAATRGNKARLFVNEWNLSSQTTEIEVSLQANAADVTVLTSTARERLTLGASGTISQKGYFVNAGGGYFEKEILNDSIVNAESLTVGAFFGIDTAGCPAYVARGSNTSEVSIASPVDGVITLSGTWFEGRGLLRGLRVADAVTAAATGALTGVDFGAGSVLGGYAWLWLTGITGTATNATITVQSSTAVGFTSPVTHGTFTVSAVGGYEVALTGTLGRYVRLNVTSLGGATNLTFTGAAGVAGVTYS